ncbi:hypothetical protein OIU34_16785 [Pararhizobium sp. BT-229]|uniref:hypothetical protein n=1 Tax=Pararhizobium sp. BT-229 TaxID=2986923 RepID=UPI0021F6DBF0|nr:hypothetical protein [Pararhizobium sp. BT-229]MCV9963561.1 hypothetical protein [Pararhizobium sp. BT-229]
MTALERFKEKWAGKAFSVLITTAIFLPLALDGLTWASKAGVEAITPKVSGGRAVVGADDVRDIKEIADRAATLLEGATAIERKVLAASESERMQLARKLDAMFEAYLMAEEKAVSDKYDKVLLQASGETSMAIRDAVRVVNNRKTRLVMTALDLKTLAAAATLDDSRMADAAVTSMKQRNLGLGEGVVAKQDREFDRRMVEFGEQAAEEIAEANAWRSKAGPIGLSRVLP